MNDHDEAHIHDGEGNEDQEFEMFAEKTKTERREALYRVIRQWKQDHHFMFVKQRDEDDWDAFGERLIEAAGVTE